MEDDAPPFAPTTGGYWAFALSQDRLPTGFPANLERVARRKLGLLLAHGSVTLDDLARLPGNRLEKLKHDRKGQYSIRVNDQWRICFVWTRSGARLVEIVDYH